MDNRPHHRQIAEKYLGFELYPWEHIHHIDFNRDNNDPSNLQIVSQREHGEIHKGDLAQIYRTAIENIRSTPTDELWQIELAKVRSVAAEMDSIHHFSIIHIRHNLGPEELALERERRKENKILHRTMIKERNKWEFEYWRKNTPLGAYRTLRSRFSHPFAHP